MTANINKHCSVCVFDLARYTQMHQRIAKLKEDNNRLWSGHSAWVAAEKKVVIYEDMIDELQKRVELLARIYDDDSAEFIRLDKRNDELEQDIARKNVLINRAIEWDENADHHGIEDLYDIIHKMRKAREKG